MIKMGEKNAKVDEKKKNLLHNKKANILVGPTK
jgi:hypothetical protein